MLCGHFYEIWVNVNENWITNKAESVNECKNKYIQHTKSRQQIKGLYFLPAWRIHACIPQHNTCT